MSALRPKVGILALTLELYESLAPGLRQGRERWLRRKVIPALESAGDVLFDKAVFRRDDVEACISRLEAQGADALLVMLLTYAPSQVALPALKRTRLPIIVWNSQELYAVDDGYDMATLTNNHGVHGTQDLCNVLLRAHVPFEYVTSHVQDEDGIKSLVDFAAAAHAVKRLRAARLGLLGYPFPGMGDFALDTTQMVATLGCEWSVLPMEEYIKRALSADARSVARLVADYRSTYDVSPGIKRADLDATARAEIALRGMIRDRKLHALTYQFLAFGDDARTPTVPFVPICRLMGEGIGFGGEGDLISAAGSSLLNWMNPPASFTEIFTIDFGGNALLMSHMGEANAAMARRGRKIPLVARSAPITRTKHGQLALVVNFEPGPATLCALTLGPGARWRLIVSAMTIPDFGPVAALQVPHFKLMPKGNVRDFLTLYAKAGGPHHSAVCFGDASARLRYAARLLDAEYCEV
jgi:L-arabinose isomerase